MTAAQTRTEEMSLILAAEECPADQFDQIHSFSEHDNRILRKLLAHGPVLLQGGRGSGKSAMMIAASRRMAPVVADAGVLGLYVSLRYVPLLQATGIDYERLFCEWVSSRVQKILADASPVDRAGADTLRETRFAFPDARDVRDLKNGLTSLAAVADKRIVLLFDDAAHIGRETSLGGFFDIFRTLSSDTISCKAAIYPGVTEFGTRFDIYNDATVTDIVRSPEQAGFGDLFEQIMKTRYPVLAPERLTGFDLGRLAAFLGSSVLGNVRGFIFACNYLLERPDSSSVGFNAVGETLLRLAADYYWPLLDEVKPKLGRYVPAVEAAQEIAEAIFDACAPTGAQAAVVHRKIIAKYAKPFEILEYAGFISRREASRAMKSGGRGPRYAVNTCNLFERSSGTRMTAKVFDDWLARSTHPVELHERGSHFDKIAPRVPDDTTDLAVFSLPVARLAKSKAYPYGLTPGKIDSLKLAGIETVGQLAALDDDELLNIDGIGAATVEKVKSVVGQAIWM